MPIRARTASASTRGSVMSSPSSSITPSSTISSRSMQRSRVDLPEPEAPISDDDLVRGDVQVEVVQHHVAAERLAQAPDAQQRPLAGSDVGLAHR